MCDTVNPNFWEPPCSLQYFSIMVPLPTPDGPHTTRGLMMLLLVSSLVLVLVLVLNLFFAILYFLTDFDGCELWFGELNTFRAHLDGRIRFIDENDMAPGVINTVRTNDNVDATMAILFVLWLLLQGYMSDVCFLIF